MLNQLTGNVYWTAPEAHTERPVLGYVNGEKTKLMIDAGNSPAHAKWFLGLLREEGLRAPDYIVLTHWHWDHVFGVGSVNGAILAHKLTADRLTEMTNLDWRDKALDQRVEEGTESIYHRDSMKNEMTNLERGRLQWRLPDISFNAGMKVNLGGVQCNILNLSDDPSVNATVVKIIPDQVVFLGETVYPDLSSEPTAYRSDIVYPALDALLAMKAEWYVSSHGPKPLSRKDFEQFDHDLRLIGANIEKHQGKRNEVMSALRRYKSIQLEKSALDWLVDAFVIGYGA